MGWTRQVRLAEERRIDWKAVAERLRGRGLAMPLRMIDGLPAFPDEEPDAEWQELRVGTPAGMVTLRQQAGRAEVVTWSDPGPELQAAAFALLWAVAGACDGVIEGEGGPMGADAFARSQGLSDSP